MSKHLMHEHGRVIYFNDDGIGEGSLLGPVRWHLAVPGTGGRGSDPRSPSLNASFLVEQCYFGQCWSIVLLPGE